LKNTDYAPDIDAATSFKSGICTGWEGLDTLSFSRHRISPNGTVRYRSARAKSAPPILLVVCSLPPFSRDTWF
jgi:hypothetical protein